MTPDPQSIQPIEDAFEDIEYNNIRKAALTLRAINHKIRQQIIKTIRDNKRLFVTDLYVKLRMEQSMASQHLAILRKAGIVTTQREGKFIFYTVNEERLHFLYGLAKEMIG